MLYCSELGDCWYEVLHMCINMALWYTKHAAKLAGTDEIKEESAKESHRCMRKAAGLFDWALRERVCCFIVVLFLSFMTNRRRLASCTAQHSTQGAKQKD